MNRLHTRHRGSRKGPMKRMQTVDIQNKIRDNEFESLAVNPAHMMTCYGEVDYDSKCKHRSIETCLSQCRKFLNIIQDDDETLDRLIAFITCHDNAPYRAHGTSKEFSIMLDLMGSWLHKHERPTAKKLSEFLRIPKLDYCRTDREVEALNVLTLNYQYHMDQIAHDLETQFDPEHPTKTEYEELIVCLERSILSEGGELPKRPPENTNSATQTDAL